MESCWWYLPWDLHWKKLFTHQPPVLSNTPELSLLHGRLVHLATIGLMCQYKLHAVFQCLVSIAGATCFCPSPKSQVLFQWKISTNFLKLPVVFLHSSNTSAPSDAFLGFLDPCTLGSSATTSKKANPRYSYSAIQPAEVGNLATNFSNTAIGPWPMSKSVTSEPLGIALHLPLSCTGCSFTACYHRKQDSFLCFFIKVWHERISLIKLVETRSSCTICWETIQP